jgi:hypothetical protein
MTASLNKLDCWNFSLMYHTKIVWKVGVDADDLAESTDVLEIGETLNKEIGKFSSATFGYDDNNEPAPKDVPTQFGTEN